MADARGPVVRVPGPPDGYASLVRLVDPTGAAMAWVDPSSAACVAFHRRGDDGAWALADPGAAGLVLPGAWRLVSRDPTSCVLAGAAGRVQIWVEDCRVRRAGPTGR